MVDGENLRWRVLAAVVLSAGIALTACGYLGQQVAIGSASQCMKKQCGSEQGRARQDCEALCRDQYGP
jgi:hypothetical protein